MIRTLLYPTEYTVQVSISTDNPVLLSKEFWRFIYGVDFVFLRNINC